MLAPTSEANTDADRRQDDGGDRHRGAESAALSIWQRFRSKPNCRVRVVATALLAIAAIAGPYAYTLRRAITVKVSGVEASVPIRVFGLGTVEARVLSKIGFEVGAAIAELHADHGDLVEQGQVLAKLNATQQEAKVAKAKAAILSAEAALKKADANVTKARAILAQRLEVNKRKQQLVSRQATSTQAAEEAQRDEDVAKADVLVAESDVEVVKAQVADARAQLAYEKAIARPAHTNRAVWCSCDRPSERAWAPSSRRAIQSSHW